MENCGYSYNSVRDGQDFSLAGCSVCPAGEPCFSIPASPLFIGKIIWISGMFECAVRHCQHVSEKVCCAIRQKMEPVRQAVRKFFCCFKL